MKKLLIVALLGFAFNTFAQTAQDTLPTAIKNDFSGKFANASALEWEVVDSLYTGMFTFDGERHMIEYNPSGTVLKHQYTLKENQIPAIIAGTLQKEFNTHKIKSIEYVESDGVVTYDVKLKGDPDYKMVFDSSGKVLAKEAD